MFGPLFVIRSVFLFTVFNGSELYLQLTIETQFLKIVFLAHRMHDKKRSGTLPL